MKKNFLCFFAMAISIVAASFSVSNDTDNRRKHTLYYWFDIDGTYASHSSQAPPECNTGSRDCAYGYITVSNPSNPVQPTGVPDLIAKKN